MLLAIALYIFDSALLLSGDEALLLRGWRSRWFAGFGASRWRLAGKEPYVPNPITPHFPFLRLKWSLEGRPHSSVGPRQVSIPSELEYFVGFVYTSLTCLFVLLPVSLFFPLGTAFTLTVVIVLYVNNLIALTLLFRLRKALNLSTRNFASIAFECLVCPPLSINLIRKLSSKMIFTEDFTAAASTLLGVDEMQAASVQCLLRVDEQIDFEPEDTPRMRALVSSRDRFLPSESP